MVLPTPMPDDERVMAFQPAYDINHMSVGSLMDLIDNNGTEDFQIDPESDFAPHWNILLETRMSAYERAKDVMLMDL